MSHSPIDPLANPTSGNPASQQQQQQQPSQQQLDPQGLGLSQDFSHSHSQHLFSHQPHHLHQQYPHGPHHQQVPPQHSTQSSASSGASTPLGGPVQGPSSVAAPSSAAGSPPTSSYVTLRIQNLPRDITSREFHLLFTFADGYAGSELQKGPVSEDGSAVSATGLAHFKSFVTASHAMAILDMKPDLFASFALSSNNAVTGTSSTSPKTLSPPFTSPVKCDIRPFAGGALLSGPTATAPQGLNRGSISAASASQRSRFAFANSDNKDEHGSADRQVMSAGSSTSATPIAGMSIDMPSAAPSTSLFSPTSPRSLFPMNQPLSAPETPAKELGSQSPFGLRQPSVAGPPPGGPSTSGGPGSMPPPPPPGAGGSNTGPQGSGQSAPPPSGRSLLLESQGREDEEFNTIVQDPVRYFNRDPTNFMAYQPMMHHPLSQPPQHHHGGPIPGAAGPPNSNSAVGGPAVRPWTDKRRASSSAVSAIGSTTRQFHSLSISGPTGPNSGQSVSNSNSGSSGNGTGPGPVGGPGNNPSNAPSNAAPGPPSDPSKLVVAYSPTNSTQAMHILQQGGRVLPPANPADQNPPCNTLYVGNLPPDTLEEELKDLFSTRPGYKRLCFRTKANGPMCFVEFEDVGYASRALEELYGYGLSNSVKGGIRLSYSKNPLGVRGSTSGAASNPGSNSGPNGMNGPGMMGGPPRSNSVVGATPVGANARYSKPF